MRPLKTAHASLCFAACAICDALYPKLQNRWPVFLATIVALQVALLVVLDYRDWVQQKVRLPHASHPSPGRTRAQSTSAGSA